MELPIRVRSYFSKRENLKTYLELLNNVFEGRGDIIDLVEIEDLVKYEWLPKIYKFILKKDNINLKEYLLDLIGHRDISPNITYLILRAYLYKHRNKKKDLDLVFKSFANIYGKSFYISNGKVRENFAKYMNRRINELLGELKDLKDLEILITTVRHNPSIIDDIPVLKKFYPVRDNTLIFREILSNTYRGRLTDFSFIGLNKKYKDLNMDLGKALLLIDDENLQRTLVKKFLKSGSVSINNKYEIVSNPVLREKYENLKEFQEVLAELI